jgi:peptidyl-dipeptidase Dcp
MRRRTFLAATAALTGATMLPAASWATETNPLLAEWTGPHGGVPPFDRVRIADLGPAIEAAMAEELREIDAITAVQGPATFANTLVPLERSGKALDRVRTLYNIWTATLSNDEVRAVETRMEPLFAQHSDRILQNGALFARIEAVYNARDTTGLTPEQKRLALIYWNRYVRAGARLPAAGKARVAAINQELAGHFTHFSQNLLADEANYVLYLTEADLAGLPADQREAAKSAARERGQPDKWAILNTRSSMEPFLTYSSRRDLRERVWRTFYSRGDNNDAHDNKQIIKQILRLRAERARLLGFATHAHWRLENNSMAQTPEAAMGLMMRVWPAAIARVRQEVAEMQAIADAEHANITIEAWDYRYYAEKVRVARYALDMNEVTPYLQMEKLREGMFWAAGRMYGFTFHPTTGIPTARPDIRVWEVKNADGSHQGYWYFDPYARVGKRSGAWMNEYKTQSTFDGPKSIIVSNNSNFVAGPAGAPVLVSWDDADTMFHEFGHALHGLNSHVTYPSLSGTRVFRDYVEFPSQINEAWLPSREVLSRFALHHQTGAPMPAELSAKIERAHTFRQGFDVTEYLASALVDMKLHLAGDADIDPDRFERETLAELGMPRELPMRHRTPQFGHVFASDGYSAGYYSYLWAEVLALDAVEAFREAPGGLYDHPTAVRLRDTIMSVGNTVDPAVAYRNFRGRDPDVGAYLRDKGFPVTA